MPAMLMSRLNKRVVAAIAGIAFLLCQTVAMAQACLTMSAPEQASASQKPCHGEGEQAESNSQCGGQGSCQFASPTAPELPVFSPADLPVVVARAYAAAVAVPDSLFDSPLLRVEPPPHSILHCCLRN
jgi:hypothetical protein